MQEIHTPLRVPELDVKGSPDAPLTLSEKVQQTLSVLTGFWRNKRVLLKASPSGILFTTNPPVQEIFHNTGSGANDNYQGETLNATEVLVIAHPDNTGLLWVRTGSAALATNAIPLEAKESVRLTITNLNMLHILTIVDGEKAIIAYSI